MWYTVVTVWSTQPDKMEQLHCFETFNNHCPDLTCQHDRVPWIYQITVVNRHKVAVLVTHSDSQKSSLVVLEMVGWPFGWVNKTLTCFSSQSQTRMRLRLASDIDWLALLDISSKKLRLWDGDNVSSPEVVLPECDKLFLEVEDMSMEFPHLIVFFNNVNHREALIKVYKMGDSVPSLVPVKTICFKENYCIDVTVMANKPIFGFATLVNDVYEIILFHKRDLYDREISPEETSRRQIQLGGGNKKVRAPYRAVINTTSIVFAKVERDEQGRELSLLMRKDFWMANDIM